MGTRDYRRREPKKPKRENKKTSISMFMPQAEVEIIKKPKKVPETTEE